MMINSHRRADVLTRTITMVSWMYTPLALACCIGIAIDDRTLVGESVWVKPLKFAVSIGLTGAATSWLRSRLPPSRSVNVAAIAVVAALIGEQALISMQAVRGVRSHFNVATGFDSAVFSSMGALVAVAFSGLLAMAIVGTRRRTASTASTASSVTDAVVRWGTWAVVVGSSVGFALVAAGAHTIGAPDGGPGLLLLNWNTTHGDLRPGHFVGLHGLQLLIVVAAIATRLGWAERTTLAALRAAGVATIALTVGLVAQAYAEQPVTSTSSLVVIATAAVLACFVARRTLRTTDLETVPASNGIAVPT